ncbi:MAG: hypothetical protein IKN71_06000 [Alphaproteobacteria bacterium]|nr:hypothetical protein [Alphaproteobacteria bacterium]
MIFKNFIQTPVSTKLMSFCVYGMASVFFLLVGNPLSMFLLHWCRPQTAAKLVHCDVLFGDRIRAFYTRLALKWPFKWAKWWIKLDDLKNYSVDEQLIYLKDVRNDYDVFSAMSPEAWILCMKNGHISRLSYAMSNLDLRDDLFIALVDFTLAEQKESSLMKEYTHFGTLTQQKATILVDKAIAESKDYPEGCLARILCEYIDRCNLRKDLLNKIADSEATPEFKERVADAHQTHLQKCIVRDLACWKDEKNPAKWRKFCKLNSKIYAGAQMEMDEEQYKIFHETGHLLDKAAIAYLLCNTTPPYCRLIFRYEPKFGIQSENIKFCLKRFVNIPPILQEEIEDFEKRLKKQMKKGIKPDSVDIEKMFDCPSAGDLALEYITKWPLPQELHKRMLEPENAEELICKYFAQGYTLDDEVMLKAISAGWIKLPPSNHSAGKIIC